MSTVKSFRLNDNELYQIEELANVLDLSEREILRLALDNLEEKTFSTASNIVTCDFDKSLNGVNTPIVNEFIKAVESNTSFKVRMYEDGHIVSFLKKE